MEAQPVQKPGDLLDDRDIEGLVTFTNNFITNVTQTDVGQPTEKAPFDDLPPS